MVEEGVRTSDPSSRRGDIEGDDDEGKSLPSAISLGMPACLRVWGRRLVERSYEGRG